MAHMIMENDTMFSAGRVKPWHYAETHEKVKLIQEAPNSREALIAAGLDWEVLQSDTYMENGIIIPGVKTNYRVLKNGDISPLGVVSSKYKIVQNTEAFEFTDSLIGETENGEVRYETAGSLCNGKRTWLLAKMPTKKILDDDVEPYMCFTNSFDGTGAIRIAMTPVRVVCWNTMNLALSTAKRQWSTKHVGDMKSKLEEAKLCLQLADTYMTNLDIEAERLANATLYKEQIDEILSELFPIEDDASETKKRNVQSMKDNFYVAYFMPDILKFGESAYRAVNAMSDVITHATPKRNTTTYEENRWKRIMDGDAIMDRFCQLVNQKISA